MRPAAAVDAVGDPRGLEPFLPGAAVGDEVHGIVVQEHVAREVFRPLERRIASTAAASDSKPSGSFGRQARAASVSCTPRPARGNSSTPRYSSRLLIWWLTAAWVIDSSFAASLKERWRAAASNTRSAFRGGRR